MDRVAKIMQPIFVHTYSYIHTTPTHTTTETLIIKFKSQEYLSEKSDKKIVMANNTNNN